MDIAKRILELCKRFNITPNKLADTSGVPRSTLQDIVSGRNKNPGINTISQICDGFAISLSDFFQEKILPPNDLPLEAILEIKSLEQYIKWKYSTKKPGQT